MLGASKGVCLTFTAVLRQSGPLVVFKTAWGFERQSTPSWERRVPRTFENGHDERQKANDSPR
eukprot:5772802-Pyramimonas_sp.AAC.1